MRKLSNILLVTLIAVFLMVGSSFALGTNITIYDNRGYSGFAAGGEDQETEPGMINNQSWDLEGFFLEGTMLTMVGGWNFVEGVAGYTYESGDIFIDTDGNASYGDGANSANNYGYDYVLDLDFDSFSYDVYKLSSGSVLTAVQEGYNDPESSPWRYDAEASSDSILMDWEDIKFTFGSLSDTEFFGTQHYAVSVSLGFLAQGTEFTSHFTIGCGNDNLMGKGMVPEPITMLLLGFGLLGLSLARRKS
jgi:hypothetical protein